MSAHGMANESRNGFWLKDFCLEDALGAILLAVMAVVAFVNVIVRYCTSFSFAWTEELTVNFFVWIVLLGSARAFRNGEHLGVCLFHDALPPAGKRLCELVFILLCIGFFAALCLTGSLEVIDEYELEAVSESLGIPVWWYTIATPLLSLLVILRICQWQLAKWRQGKAVQHEEESARA